MSSAVTGLLFSGLSIVVVWFVVKERLGTLGFADPSIGLYIGLGILGFFGLFGFFGGWSISWFAGLGSLLGLARLAAVGLAFALLFQPEVEHWLKSRPGNQPKNPSPPLQQGHPQQPPPPGQPGQPGQSMPPQPPAG